MPPSHNTAGRRGCRRFWHVIADRKPRTLLPANRDFGRLDQFAIPKRRTFAFPSLASYIVHVGKVIYMPDYKLILSTAGSQEEAEKIAHALVERRLAACVNIVPVMHSVFRWEGNIEEARECLLLIKTAGSAIERVRDAVRELHSYDVPELIVLGIEGGSETYLSWIGESVG